MEISKKQKVVNAVNAKNWKSAFSLVKNFNREFNKDEQRALQIASECENGNASFYTQLGIDTCSEIKKAKSILTRYSL